VLAQGAARIALYPILIAVALVAELFVTSGVSPLVTLRPLIVAIVAGALLSGLGRVLLGDRDRGGIFAVLAMFLFLVGADIRIALLLGLAIGLQFVERYALPAARRFRWGVIGRFVSRASAVLLLAIGIQAVQLGTPALIVRALTEEAPFRAASTVPPPSAASRPDIYVLLLDGHARPDVLRQVFGHDETGFMTALGSRGFEVATRSRTNYSITTQVLAGMFNMRPLDEIEAIRPLLADTASQPAGSIIREAINDGPVLPRLRKEGYELVAFASSFEEPALRSVDRWIDTGDLNEFEVNLFRRTILRALLPVVAPDWVSSNYRSRVETEFRQLAEIAAERSDRPKFVWGHLPTPHAPWFYTADGEPRTVLDVEKTWAETPANTGLDLETLMAGYAGQVEWVDRQVVETIDRILASSARPPVIVVFGDHGSWIGSDGGDFRLRFLPLFAARMPDGSKPFPDDIQLVNLFPILFNELFGDDVPLVAESPSYMYRLREYDLAAISDPNGALSGPAAIR
jgi:Sulfatase